MGHRRAFAILLGMSLLGAGSLGAAKGPLLRLSDRTVDFGRVDQFQQVKGDVTIRNEGDAPLLILKIDSDCGCTAGVPGDSVILPGKETLLSIAFSTRNYKGNQKKTVILHTNDPAEPKASIRVLCDVHPVVRIEPEQVQFGLVDKGKTATKRVRVSADKGTNLKVVRLSGCEELLTWKVTPDPSSNEDAFWIDLTTRADAPAGVFRRSMGLEVTGPPVPSMMSLSVAGTIYSYFLVGKDARIVLHGTHKGEPSEGVIPITCDGSKPYELLGVSSTVPYLKGEIVPDGKNTYELKITATSAAPVGRFQEMLTIQTTDPEQPTIEIRVRGEVRG